MTDGSGTGIPSGSALAAEARGALAKKGLHPTDEWMLSFLSTQKLSTRSQSLASTASFRLLASNITTTLSRSLTASFPPDIQSASTKERKLPAGSLVVQILDVEDMGRSRWEQIEALEALERGEGSKGRELIRLDRAEDGEEEEQAPAMRSSSTIMADLQKSKGPHKILMQDIHGSTAYGIELAKVEGVSLNTNLGAKLLLKSPLVARGVVLLEPSTVTWLGGRIDALHQSWHRDRKERLLAGITAVSTSGR